MVANTARYAVAVRDATALWLFFGLTRNALGDLRAFWVNGYGERTWKSRNPHVTYYHTGEVHFETFGKPSYIRREQPLDASFSGAVQMTSAVIDLESVRAANRSCRAEEFAGRLFEIPACELSPNLAACRTAIAVDVVSLGAPPVIYPRAAEIRRRVFDDAFPYISVTLWDQEMFSKVGHAPY